MERHYRSIAVAVLFLSLAVLNSLRSQAQGNNSQIIPPQAKFLPTDGDGLSNQADSGRDFTNQTGGGLRALAASDDVRVIQGLPGMGLIQTSIPVTGNAKEIAIAPNGRFALVLTTGNRVAVVVDPAGTTPTQSTTLDVGGNPVGVAISEDSAFAVVLVGTNPARIVPVLGLPGNPQTGPPFTLTQVTFGAQDIAISPATGTVVVTAASIAGVAIVDGFRIPGGPSLRGVVRTGIEPGGLVITNDGSTAFVVNHGGDGVAAVTGLAPGGLPAMGRVVNPGSRPRDIALSSDGTLAVVTTQGDDSITVYRVSGATLAELLKFGVGSAPGSISMTPDGNTAIIANTGDQSISVVTNLRGVPLANLLVGPSPLLLTDADREQAISFVP
jgi:DNA-binding beta-propeller fold protein YncE